MKGDEKMNAGSATMGMIGSLCPQREKYWKELTDTEKIERLRIVLKRKENKIDSLESMIYKLTRLFEEHIHLDGKLVMSIYARNLDPGQGKAYVSKEQEAKGEVYF